MDEALADEELYGEGSRWRGSLLGLRANALARARGDLEPARELLAGGRLNEVDALLTRLYLARSEMAAGELAAARSSLTEARRVFDELDARATSDGESGRPVAQHAYLTALEARLARLSGSDDLSASGGLDAARLRVRSWISGEASRHGPVGSASSTTVTGASSCAS